MLNKADIEYRVIKVATDGIGCDENTIAEIFGCQTSSDIANLRQQFTNSIQPSGSNSYDLLQLIERKVTKDVIMQKFLLRVLRCDREEGLQVNAALAVSQVCDDLSLKLLYNFMLQLL